MCLCAISIKQILSCSGRIPHGLFGQVVYIATVCRQTGPVVVMRSRSVSIEHCMKYVNNFFNLFPDLARWKIWTCNIHSCKQSSSFLWSNHAFREALLDHTHQLLTSLQIHLTSNLIILPERWPWAEPKSVSRVDYHQFFCQKYFIFDIFTAENN